MRIHRLIDARNASRFTSRVAALASLLCLSIGAATPAAAGPALDHIKSTGHIRLGYLDDARPFSFKGANGPDGYAITLCQRIVEQLKSQLVMQGLTADWTLVNGKNRFSEVEKGDIDLLCAPTAVTLSKREKVAFSLPVFHGGNRAIVRDDTAESLRRVLAEHPTNRAVWRGTPAANALTNTKSTVVAGTSTQKWLEGRRSALQISADITPVPDYRTGLQRLIDRKSDIFFGERSLALGALGTMDPSARDRVVILDRMFTNEVIAFALPRNDDDFRLLVDRSLSRIYGSDQFAPLYTKWVGELDEPTRQFFQGVALAE